MSEGLDLLGQLLICLTPRDPKKRSLNNIIVFLRGVIAPTFCRQSDLSELGDL